MTSWDPYPWDQSRGQHFYTRLFHWLCIQAWTLRHADVVSLTVDITTLTDLNSELLGNGPGVCIMFEGSWPKVREKFTVKQIVNRVTGTEVLIRLDPFRSLAFDVEEERFDT